MQPLSARSYWDQKQRRTPNFHFAHLQLIPAMVLLGCGLSIRTALSNHNASSPSSLQMTSHGLGLCHCIMCQHIGAVTWKSTGYLCHGPFQVMLHSGCCLLDTRTGQFLQAQVATHGSLAWCSQVITVKTLDLFFPGSVPWPLEGKQTMEIGIPMSENCS